jgi:polygalacturonase
MKRVSHKASKDRGPLVLFGCGIMVLFLSVATARGAPALPAINTNNIVNITNYGANVANADNASAIQSAINAAAAGYTNGGYGGTVEIPPGVFLCGPLSLKNSINLQIDAGATLRLLPYGSYPTNGGPFSFIGGSNLKDVEISGSGGIDGQGSPWWPGRSALRPPIINLSSCTRVLIQDITISNPPVNHIAVKGKNAGNVTIQRITELAPASTDPVNPSHNTDGIDLAETNVLIQSCFINTGDDNIAMGSSAGLRGTFW